MAIQACASAVRLPEADDSYNLLLGNLKPDKKFSKSKMAISKKELIKLLKFSKVMIALLSFNFHDNNFCSQRVVELSENPNIFAQVS